MQSQFNSIAQVFNIPVLCIITAVIVIGWSVFGALSFQKMRRIGAGLLVITLSVILFITIFSRSKIDASVYTEPFSTFQRAKTQKALYDFMIMNIIMFTPLGASLPYVLPGKTGVRILLTILIGFALSCMIETAQYVFSIGYTDVDDVIVNTLGTALGSLSYPLTLLWLKLGKKEL